MPITRATIERYWTRRVRTLAFSIDTTGTVTTHPSPVALTGSAVSPDRMAARPVQPGAGSVWVDAYERNGRIVHGYWRRR